MKRKPWEPANMVGWYDPSQLLRTGLQVAKSSLFAENADGRLVQPLFDPSDAPIDERFAGGGQEGAAPPRASITLDYIADTGDGFDSTYGVAYWATEDALTLGPPGREERLPRGEVLVLGGDLVYPAASGNEYERRFVKPFEMASANFPDGVASLYAIPGNHDWYDNLVAFTRLFINRENIGKFAARQTRSYFALRLPHGWWLLAPDVQLGSDIDYKQHQYFLDIIEHRLPADAKVILCVAEPHWVTENEELRSGGDWEGRSALLRQLEAELHGETGRIRAIIAGDLHHYRRHLGRVGTSPRDVHLVTAGGGGAFLHPTHAWRDGSDPARRRRDARLPEGLPHYRFQAAYPSPERSRCLAWRVLGFPVLNGRFLWASGALYGAMALQVILEARLLCGAVGRQDCADALQHAVFAPGVVALAVVIVAGFVAFTDTSKKGYRLIAGGAHGLANVLVAIGLPAALLRWSGVLEIRGVVGALALVILLVGVTLVGAVFGAAVMGAYLFVSLNWFGRHRNEAFSAIKEERYKSFLRIRIDEAGDAHVHVIGLDAPPRAWSPPFDGAAPSGPTRRVPAGVHTPPRVVDRFTLKGSDTPPTP